LYLGLRQMEWLFITCHNYWIVCRLVRDDDHPFLAYSPKISIEDSSEPFRAFLGAVLSATKGVSVESSAFSPDMQLDTIIEDEGEGDSYEGGIDGGSGACQGSSSKTSATDPPVTRTRGRAGHENAEFELMVCPLLDRYLVIYHLASSSTLRLLHLLPTRLNPSKYGCISMPY
jgi:hypothetical protein